MKNTFVTSALRPIKCQSNTRIGRSNDGGYIVPRDICVKSTQLVSLGISLDWSFEEAFLKVNPDCQVDCYDKTTSFWRALTWGISRFAYSPISRRKSHFAAILTPFKYAFFSRKNVRLYQKFVGTESSSDFASIESVLSVCKEPNSSFLKIDIEGAEYDILDQIILNHDRISAIAIEFHRVQEEPKFSRLMELLLEHFYVTHIHANSAGGADSNHRPHLLEATFVHKALVQNPEYHVGDTYRHPDDACNLPQVEDFLITFQD